MGNDLQRGHRFQQVPVQRHQPPDDEGSRGREQAAAIQWRAQDRFSFNGHARIGCAPKPAATGRTGNCAIGARDFQIGWGSIDGAADP